MQQLLLRLMTWIGLRKGETDEATNDDVSYVRLDRESGRVSGSSGGGAGQDPAGDEGGVSEAVVPARSSRWSADQDRPQAPAGDGLGYWGSKVPGDPSSGRPGE